MFMNTYMGCLLLACIYFALFYVWGRFFLIVIHAKGGICENILLGYCTVQVLFQIPYLFVFINRGSFRSLSVIWLIVMSFLTVLVSFYIARCHQNTDRQTMNNKQKIAAAITVVLVLSMMVYLTLRENYHSYDPRNYIRELNSMVYDDKIWNTDGAIDFHHGMSSMLSFFAMPSLFTVISPYYISFFMVRIIGIILFSLSSYHLAEIVFEKKETIVSYYGLTAAVLTPLLLMLWGSAYTAEFFNLRIYESKGYLQFVFFPIAFTVCLEMFKDGTREKECWDKQILLGFSAVAIGPSSLTSYLILLLMCMTAKLAYSKFAGSWRTIGWTVLAACPNLCYLLVYFLIIRRYLVL